VAEIVDIPVTDLLLNSENPRLGGGSTTQNETALELAKQQGDNLVRLAEDIVEKGLDPTTLTAVVATGDRRKRYDVLEGNRRILAIRALETPALVAPALTPASNRKLTELAARYEKEPIDEVTCVLFEDETEAMHWIELRHTGMNQGIGLVEWGADEKARFQELHKGRPNPARQLIDFVEKAGGLSAAALASNRKILTNVERLIETPYVREKLGIGLAEGQLVALHPADELKKGLTRVVEDLKTGQITVPQLYHAEDRRTYVDSLPKASLPKKSTQLDAPVRLDDLAAGKTPRTVTPKAPPRRRRTTRTTVITKTAQLDVTHPRINRVYNELLLLNAEQFPNACSVLLRVFIELSVDHYLNTNNVMTDHQIRNTPLAKRLSTTADHLNKNGKISAKLKSAVDTVASRAKNTLGGPTVVTFNQYVHNEYVFPRSNELYTTWDELEPFVVQLWPVT
jgi:hypothetical protein